MRYVFDTSAWLEYLNAGSHGERVRKILRRPGAVITPAVVAAEIIEAARLRGASSKHFLDFLTSRSEFAAVTPEIARLAGKISAERGHPPNAWTIVESLVLATARHHGARLVTRDPIYRDTDHLLWL